MTGAAHPKTAADVELSSRSRVQSGAAPRLGTAGWWAILGLGLSLLEAIVRLARRAADTLEQGLSAGQWLAFAALTLCFVYFEGYRAFQCRFVPRAVRRAYELPRASRASRCLAPFYVAGLVGVDGWRALARAWLGVALIVLAVVVVQQLPAPWRGIVDGAVATALGWGLTTLVLQLTAKLNADRSAAPITRALRVPGRRSVTHPRAPLR